MRLRAFAVMAVGALGVTAATAILQTSTAAQAAQALTGVVTSPQEAKMEGVVVSARRDGSIATVSVVSDKDGKYAFPSAHVGPGKYSISIRAAGYDLVSTAATEVAAGKTTSLDLKLDKTKNLASQLSSAEWLNSI